MKGKQTQAAQLFQALPSKFVRTAEALRAKKAEQGGADTSAPAEAEVAE